MQLPDITIKKPSDWLLYSSILMLFLGVTNGIWELEVVESERSDALFVGGMLLFTWVLLRFNPPKERRKRTRPDYPATEKEKDFIKRIEGKISVKEAAKLPTCNGIDSEELQRIVNEQYIECGVCRGKLKRTFEHGQYYVERR